MPTPPTPKLRDLPVLSCVPFDDVGIVRAALWQFERGRFDRAALLCDSFGTDDRIKGVLDTRVDALFSLPLEVTPHGDGRKAAPVAARLEDEWRQMFPSEELKSFLRWAVLLRVAFGRFEPVEQSGARWKFRFRCWSPHFVRWDWDSRSFWTQVDGGKEQEITPGRNGWVVYAPEGVQRGWMGGLVRSLALLYLTRRWSFRDWARYSEVHGLPFRLAAVPAAASEEDKRAFERDVQNIGSEAVFRVAKDEQGNGFDVKLVEAAAQSWQGFLQLINKSDECIAVDVLGQNLTTSAKTGGSYALGNIHDRIRLDRLEGDAQSLAPCLREQCVTVWAEANEGDRDLAPEAAWSTKAPEDRAATAKTLSDAGDALKKLRDAGLNVDRVAFAKQYRIPLDEKQPLREPEPEPAAKPEPTTQPNPQAEPDKGDENQTDG